MSGYDQSRAGFSQRAHEFILHGSYWFGVLALMLQLVGYGGYGVKDVTSETYDFVRSYTPVSFAAGGIMLWPDDPDGYHWLAKLKGAHWGLPVQLVFGAIGLAVLGALLALLALVFRRKKWIWSALAFLLSFAPALLSVGLIYQSGGRWGHMP